MKTGIRIEGGAELAKALQQLSVRVSKNVLRDALLDVAAPPLERGMARRAARAPGAPDLAEHMTTSVAASSGRSAAVVVGPSTEVRSDQPGTTFDEQGRYVEFGTVDTPMQAFARPTFDSDAPKVITPMGAALWATLVGRGFSRPSVAGGPVAGGPRGSLL
jgi:HK97 gp10 family phage protein